MSKITYSFGARGNFKELEPFLLPQQLERVEKSNFSIMYLLFQDIITESEKVKHFNRLAKYIDKALKENNERARR